MGLARRTVAGLPPLMRAGLGLAALGGVIDIGYHLGFDPADTHGTVAFVGHVTTLIGMLVTMLGLVGSVIKHRSTESFPQTKGDTR